ncbi:protein of unknown function DUF928 [Leptolyngbyaceae cyanobacterium JSC-12]|nr:protein of unknown function DUF928 [Leptolyngbyaceae cyanobacterium JSC-12]
MNSFLNPQSLLVVPALVALSLPSTAIASVPQTSSRSSWFAPSGTLKISQSFKPPSRGTAPPTAGGATRGESCLKGPKHLTSLVPKDRLGLTYSGNPTFHWFVPKSPARTAKFLLLGNDDADVVYETTLSLPSESGIVSFTLPEDGPSLEVGQQYHWFLVVGCSQIDQGANPSVEGWVERVSPETNILSQLKQATAAGRVKIYADNGIWHEAVTTLVTLRKTNPTDKALLAGWSELLKSVGLDAIAPEPLLNANLSKK